MNENNQSKHQALTVGGILLLLVLLLVGVSYLAPTREVKEKTPLTIELPNVFDDVDVLGHAAVIYDVKNEEVLYGKAEEAQLPLASITKLLTTYVATTALGENGFVDITAEDLRTEGDSGLLVSETWRVGDLARFVLTTSSNDAAHALARRVSERANETPDVFLSQAAAALSLSQTFALNGTGLDTNTHISGAYGSAKDIALLLADIYEENRSLLLGSSASAATFYSTEGFAHNASSTNSLADSLPNLVGAKTGYTDLAGGNLAVLIEVAPGRPVALVVLGSTRDGRFVDMEELVEATLQHFTYSSAL